MPRLVCITGAVRDAPELWSHPDEDKRCSADLNSRLGKPEVLPSLVLAIPLFARRA